MLLKRRATCGQALALAFGFGFHPLESISRNPKRTVMRKEKTEELQCCLTGLVHSSDGDWRSFPEPFDINRPPKPNQGPSFGTASYLNSRFSTQQVRFI